MAMGSEQQQTVGSRTVSVEEVPAVLQLRATQDPPRSQEAMPTRHNVRWEENVIDNENMNKKDQDMLHFHPQNEDEEECNHHSDDDGSSSSGSSSSESENEKDLDFNERRQRRLERRHRKLEKKGHIAPMLMKSNQIILNTGENSRKRRTEALYNESQNIR